jgi:DNA-binding transcriptional LysR family regulator
MELSDLRYFYNVAVSRSFSRGAALSHVSPPAISKTIKKLEEELQTQLFVRTTRSVALSPGGEILLQRCRRIFAEVDALGRDLDEAESRIRGPLRIAANEVFSLHLLPAALSALLSQHPELAPSTYEMIPTQIEQRIADGLIDVGFTIGGGGSPQIEYHLLGRSKAVVVAGKSHPLYRRGNIERADLERFPLVAPRFFGLEHLPSLDQFPEDRWHRRIGATIELLQMGIELAAGGTHLGYFPEVSVRPQLHSGRLRTLTGLGATEPFELRALTRKGAPLRPSVQLLIESVERHLRSPGAQRPNLRARRSAPARRRSS